jgi:hypothetical protein
MSINPTAVWRVRKSGSNMNGGGYDPSISGAGTDYSQQDTAQLALSDIACSNTTAISSVTGGFTSAMVGNAIWITGGGATAGAYFLNAVSGPNNATVDRSPGTISAGSGNVGGGWADPWTNVVSTCVYPGNTVYIQGAGTNTPTVDDYSIGGHVNSVGDTVNGNINYIGQNGKPRLGGGGLMYFYTGYNWFSNIYFAANGTNYGSYGFMHDGGATYNGTNYLIDCVLDQNGHDICMIQGAWFVLRCEIFSRIAASGSSYAVIGQNFGTQILFCNIHDTVGHGVQLDNHLGNHISDSIIARCNGDGLTFSGSYQGTDGGGNGADNVTIDGNAGHGVNFIDANGLQEAIVINCIISNHTGSGKYGIYCGINSTAINDAMKGLVDYNSFYGNTNDLFQISHGPNDIIGVNPEYAAESTEGYQVSINLKARGFPQAAFHNSLAGMTPTQSYIDQGGVQRQEGAA